MKQLNIFNTENKLNEKQSIWKLFIDGAARNNPGPAGVGIYLIRDNDFIKKTGFYLGSKTNNQAEYLALLIGLYFASKNMNKNDKLEIISDSELLVRQISGIYKIKNPELQKLHAASLKMLNSLNYTIKHVLREENKEADKQANEAIDKKRIVPQEIITFLNSYEVTI